MLTMKLRCFLFSLHFCNFLFVAAILLIFSFPCSIAFFLAAGNGAVASSHKGFAAVGAGQVSRVTWYTTV